MVTKSAVVKLRKENVEVLILCTLEKNKLINGMVNPAPIAIMVVGISARIIIFQSYSLRSLLFSVMMGTCSFLFIRIRKYTPINPIALMANNKFCSLNMVLFIPLNTPTTKLPIILAMLQVAKFKVMANVC